MKRGIVILLLSAACTEFLGGRLSSWWPPRNCRSPGFLPSGAVLYLEAKDFSSLLSAWSGSPQKQQWLKSASV